MVIQRIQTLWLLCAMVCAVMSIYLPWFNDGTTAMPTAASPVMLTLVVLVAVLTLLAIFMYRNLNRQKQVASIVACVATVAAIYPFLFCAGNAESGIYADKGSLLLLGTAVFALLARRGMTKDERLLRSADRLR